MNVFGLFDSWTKACASAYLIGSLCGSWCLAAQSEARVVLPADVTPEIYRIQITPDSAALTFKGAAQIDITVHKATDRIVLNSLELIIGSAAIAAGPSVERIGYDSVNQTATFELSSRVRPGRYTLSLDYTGKIFQQASGLFALDYETAHGKSRALFTQFENSDARRFVPCWDEPGLKAAFDLTATVPANLMPLSNMPIASTQWRDGAKIVHFAATPKMSTYLLFFGLGDFERVHRDVAGVDVGIVVKRGDTAFAQFSLAAASNILPYYNEYFGLPYPLPKLDLIAGPGSSQFFGAMENWGAIFYFESYLLIDPRISTETDKQSVYNVVAHEMAHQWFGDLVTMQWWDDVWLNEGFATWMSNRVTDHFHPEWKVWLQAHQSTQEAMEEDERDGTHPIVTPIYDVLQANSAFDTITYSKGSAVIRMLEAYVGEDDFRAGVRRYIRDHAYGNTVSDDLWTSIDLMGHRPVRQIAHDFTLQAGVPMIEQLSAACSGGKTLSMMKQTHFAIDRDSTAARVWRVPLATAHPQGPLHAALVAGQAPHAIEQDGCGTVILNAGQTGYFRSHYSPEGLADVTAHYPTLSSEDQLGFLQDTDALAFAGQEPMSALLELADHVPADADPVVASALVNGLRSLDRLYDGLPARREFRSYARPLLNSLFSRIGWDARGGEGDNVASLRASLIYALSAMGDEAVIAEADKRFRQFTSDPSRVAADTRKTVLRVVARHANASTWNQLHEMARSAKSEIERAQFYTLLAMPEDTTLVRRALALALSGEPPPTIAPQIVTSASAEHPDIAFEYATDHWGELATLIEPSSQARFVPGLVTSAFDTTLINRLNAFADAHIPQSARKDLRKSESSIRYRAEIRSERLPQADDWLKHRLAAAYHRRIETST